MSSPIQVHGLTDVGNIRQQNEDYFLIADVQKSLEIRSSALPEQDHTHLEGILLGTLLIVADGVGGSVHGAEASSHAVDFIARYVSSTVGCFDNSPRSQDQEVLDEFDTAIKLSHAAIRAETDESPRLKGMATTLTIAFVVDHHVYIAHVGDSRCYAVRQGQLSLITKDQTIAQHLVDEGVLSPESAEQSSFSQMLASAVGMEGTEPVVMTYKLELEPGDSLLLCTDGLTKHVEDRLIGQYLASEGSPEDICRRLVEDSLAGGGSDNVTVIVARV